MDEHPGIVFVEGPAGRRPALASRRGLDVWQVISTLHDNDGNVGDTADVLRLPESEVRGALAYYADYRGEIDDWIRTNDELFERYETASGLTIDPKRLKYFRVFNDFSSTVHMLASAWRVARHGKTLQDVVVTWLSMIGNVIAGGLRDTLEEGAVAADVERLHMVAKCLRAVQVGAG